MASALGIKAGKAFVVIEALDKTGRVLNQVAKKFDAMGAKVMSLGKQIVTSLALGALPGGFALKTFQSFDDSMLKLEARSRGTAEEMISLRDQAAKLGRQTAFTAQDVGELQTQLAMKGFTRGEILQQTPHVLALARATGDLRDSMEDMTLAAELTAIVMRTFGIDATDTQHVVDTLTVGVKQSGLTLGLMMESFKYIGPLAKQAGMSLEETVTIIGMLNRIGIKGSIAGTAVRRTLINIANESKRNKFSEALKQATGETVDFVDQAGNLRKVHEILFDIGNKIKNLGSAKKFSVLEKLVGDIALPSSTALSASQNPFEGMLEAQKASVGEAQRTMDKMESGIGGAWRRLSGSAEGVGLQIGAALAKPLIKLSAWFEKNDDDLAKFIERNQELVQKIAGTLAGIMALGVAMVIFGGALKLVGATLHLAAFAATTFTTAIASLFSLARGLISILATIGSAISGVVGVVGTLASAFMSLATGIIATLIPVISTLATALVGIATVIVGGVVAAAHVLFGVMVAVAGSTLAAFGLVGTVVSGSTIFMLALGAAAVAAGYLIIQAFAGVAGAIGSIFSGIGSTIDSAMSSVTSVITSAMDAGKSAVQSFWDTCVSAGQAIADVFQSMAETITTSFGVAIKALVAGDIGRAAEAAWGGVKVAFMQGSAFVKNVWDAFTVGIMNAWTSFSSTLQTGMLSVWYGIRSIWLAGMEFIETGWLNLWVTVAKTFRNWGSDFKESYIDFIESLPFTGDQSEARAAIEEHRNAPVAGEEWLKDMQADFAKQRKELASEEATAIGLVSSDKEVEDRNKALQQRMDERNQIVHDAQEELTRDLNDIQRELAWKELEALMGPEAEQIDLREFNPDKFVAATKVPDANVPVKAVEGAEKGTAEAMKHFVENQRPDWSKQLIDVNKAQLEQLEDINSNLEDDNEFVEVG